MRAEAAVWADGRVAGFTDRVPFFLMTVSSEKRMAAAEEFITGMAQEGIGFLGNEDLTHDTRRAEFKKLLYVHFDMETIGRFALGRYWRVATKKERAEYQRLFRDMVVDVYSKRFEEYNGQDLQVSGSRMQGDDIIVHSFIVFDSAPEVRVDWRVRYKNGRYHVIDVIVEGVSMTLTQRSDFSSVIQRGGGTVEALLEHMRK